MRFPHEKLLVYQEALLFAQWVEISLRPSLKGRAHLIDQIARASSSILLNIAEGANRWGPADKGRFYQFAMGSAGECSSILDLVGASALYDVDAVDWIDQRARLAKIASLLVGLLQSMAKRSEG